MPDQFWAGVTASGGRRYRARNVLCRASSVPLSGTKHAECRRQRRDVKHLGLPRAHASIARFDDFVVWAANEGSRARPLRAKIMTPDSPPNSHASTQAPVPVELAEVGLGPRVIELDRPRLRILFAFPAEEGIRGTKANDNAAADCGRENELPEQSATSANRADTSGSPIADGSPALSEVSFRTGMTSATTALAVRYRGPGTSSSPVRPTTSTPSWWLRRL